MSERLEGLDRRAFLRGLMLTSAGLLVPRPARVFMPAMESRCSIGVDEGIGTVLNYYQVEIDGKLFTFIDYSGLMSKLDAAAFDR